MNDQENKTKSCKNCKEEKNITEFHKNGKSTHPICKVCRAILRKQIRYEKPSSGTRVCPKCGEEVDITKIKYYKL